MNILISPDKFKGSLTALEAAEAMKKGLESKIPNIKITLSPVADGGDGTLDTIIETTGGQKIVKEVTGPYEKPVKASYGIIPKKSNEPLTAVIEMAQASGLSLIKKAKKPLEATTYGTGELINAALEKGCQKIIITVGGSATNDGGTGALQALGIMFLNSQRKPLGLGGTHLAAITSVDESKLNKKAKLTEFVIATDVDNPFYGPNGAINTYAKQKGASAAQRQQLEAGFKSFAKLILKEKNIDLQKIPGSGAAGGLAGGLLAFLPNVSIVNGFSIISKITNLENKIKNSDYIITGEGQIDEQTIHGKAPCGVYKLAKKHNKKILFITGQLGKDWQKTLEYFEVIYTLTGLRAIIRQNEPKIEVPFQHRIAMYFQKIKISEKFASKNAFILTEKLTPFFFKDFIEREEKNKTAATD
jgi:glycerate kinase